MLNIMVTLELDHLPPRAGPCALGADLVLDSLDLGLKPYCPIKHCCPR